MVEQWVIIIDNGNRSRNGDWKPNRLEVAKDVAGFIAGTVTSESPESTAGLVTIAEGQVKVPVCATNDVCVILGGLRCITGGGEADFTRGLSVSMLMLKNQGAHTATNRVVMILTSKIAGGVKGGRLVKQLRKNGIRLDLVTFIDEPEEKAALEAFLGFDGDLGDSNLAKVHVVSKNENGVSDAQYACEFLQSKVFDIPAAGSGSSGQRGMAVNTTDVLDYADDPDLALAIRLSMQDQGGPTGISAGHDGITTSESIELGGGTREDILNAAGLDPELREALLLSLENDTDEDSNSTSTDMDDNISGDDDSEDAESSSEESYDGSIPDRALTTRSMARLCGDVLQATAAATNAAAKESGGQVEPVEASSHSTATAPANRDEAILQESLQSQGLELTGAVRRALGNLIDVARPNKDNSEPKSVSKETRDSSSEDKDKKEDKKEEE